MGDYYRFAQMLLDDGELDGVRVLGPKSVELMTRKHVPEALLQRAGWGELGWGLGVAVRITPPLQAPGSVGAFGWNGGTGTQYLVDPTERLVVVVFLPSQPRTAGIAEARDDFIAAAYQAIVAPLRKGGP